VDVDVAGGKIYGRILDMRVSSDVILMGAKGNACLSIRSAIIYRLDLKMAKCTGQKR